MRSRKIAGMAIPRTILHDISGNERSQHLVFKPFPIDVAARFGEPFRSALFRAQEKSSICSTLPSKRRCSKAANVVCPTRMARRSPQTHARVP